MVPDTFVFLLDAVLGSFRPGAEEFIVALEGKGPLDPLDRPFAGRKMSAVDQGYRYAINLPSDWIIVTSMRQTRLYFKGADQYTYERFDTERLADDDALLKRFLFLLGAERAVPETGRCHLYNLLTTSEKVGKELTKEFYFRYAEMRQNAFEHLCRENPSLSPNALLSATQKLLDRILFCAFCEDRGLLPSDTIHRAYEHRDPYRVATAEACWGRSEQSDCLARCRDHRRRDWPASRTRVLSRCGPVQVDRSSGTESRRATRRN